MPLGVEGGAGAASCADACADETSTDTAAVIGGMATAGVSRELRRRLPAAAFSFVFSVWCTPLTTLTREDDPPAIAAAAVSFFVDSGALARRSFEFADARNGCAVAAAAGMGGGATSPRVARRRERDDAVSARTDAGNAAVTVPRPDPVPRERENEMSGFSIEDKETGGGNNTHIRTCSSQRLFPSRQHVNTHGNTGISVRRRHGASPRARS